MLPKILSVIFSSDGAADEKLPVCFLLTEPKRVRGFNRICTGVFDNGLQPSPICVYRQHT